jgi:5'-phosphate synthase pdxT subunit
MARVGVLALQGGFAPHLQALQEAGLEACEVRSKEELEGVEGMVLPGGESTAQKRLLERHGLWSALAAFGASGRPILATCAGLILAARQVRPAQTSFGWLDVAVDRNAYGRQLDSFEDLADGGEPLVFIRAPRILSVGEGVEVLVRWRGEPVLVRGGAVVGATFHPELTRDRRVHRLAFSSLLQGRQAQRARVT